jgi:hypothetical protein
MHVSNKFGIHGEVYNPHVSWNDALTHKNYFHTVVHVNKTDPVSAFYPFITAEKFDSRYNKNAKPFLGQHGIENFLRPKPASRTTSKIQKIQTFENVPATVKSNGGLKSRVRPVTTTPVISQTYTHYGGGQDLTSRTMDCTHMSYYQKVVHGCPQRKRGSS